MIYPLGCTVIIRNVTTTKQSFLKGHSNNISCLAVSKSGKFIASGQVCFQPIFKNYTQKTNFSVGSIER